LKKKYLTLEEKLQLDKDKLELKYNSALDKEKKREKKRKIKIARNNLIDNVDTLLDRMDRLENRLNVIVDRLTELKSEPSLKSICKNCRYSKKNNGVECKEYFKSLGTERCTIKHLKWKSVIKKKNNICPKCNKTDFEEHWHTSGGLYYHNHRTCKNCGFKGIIKTPKLEKKSKKYKEDDNCTVCKKGKLCFKKSIKTGKCHSCREKEDPENNKFCDE
jgi:hypothetical protein